MLSTDGFPDWGVVLVETNFFVKLGASVYHPYWGLKIHQKSLTSEITHGQSTIN